MSNGWWVELNRCSYWKPGAAATLRWLELRLSGSAEWSLIANSQSGWITTLRSRDKKKRNRVSYTPVTEKHSPVAPPGRNKLDEAHKRLGHVSFFTYLLPYQWMHWKMVELQTDFANWYFTATFAWIKGDWAEINTRRYRDNRILYVWTFQIPAKSDI